MNDQYAITHNGILLKYWGEGFDIFRNKFDVWFIVDEKQREKYYPIQTIFYQTGSTKVKRNSEFNGESNEFDIKIRGFQ